MIVRSKVLMLRKTPYGETSVVAACLSPELGRVDLMLRGARRISSKKFPVADLFRELDVELASERGGSALRSPRSLELSRDFDGIASDSASYSAACALCAMASRSSVPGTPCPALYAAMLEAFGKLATGAAPDDVSWLVELVNLEEHGVLPESPTPEGRALAKRLFLAGQGLEAIPDIEPEKLAAIKSWVGKLCLKEGFSRDYGSSPLQTPREDGTR
jgi:DNA repair protein RecO